MKILLILGLVYAAAVALQANGASVPYAAPVASPYSQPAGTPYSTQPYATGGVAVR